MIKSSLAEIPDSTRKSIKQGEAIIIFAGISILSTCTLLGYCVYNSAMATNSNPVLEPTHITLPSPSSTPIPFITQVPEGTPTSGKADFFHDPAAIGLATIVAAGLAVGTYATISNLTGNSA